MTHDELGSITRAEIASQPECWQRALDLAASGVAGFPEPGERVLALGCGTSYYVGQALCWLREAAGHGHSDALIASELPPVLRPYDRVVAISRSGTSSQLLDAIDRLRKEQPEARITALLGDQASPLAGMVHDVVDLSFADERSVVQTRFPTTQLVLVRAWLHGVSSADVSGLPEAGARALSCALPSRDIAQLVVLGHGWGAAVAQEAALKVRESAGAWAEAYAVGEYLHGPVATSTASTLVWGLDALPDDVRDAVIRSGGTLEHGGGEPLVELVRLHSFAVDLASANGLDADRPASLSRSVIRS